MYEQLKDVDTIGASGTPNSQAIAALKPDLIIDQFYTEKSAPLRTIAPVAFFDWHTSGAFRNEQIAELAEAVNRESRLGERKKEYESRVTEVKSACRKQIDTPTWAP
ncbi:ABC transporter substrate-binding protein [Streptomyces cyaneofuscatus]|uniref:ABC transporter substrate-binding protein n=1 Tax=Streptomyces cyaneofuscatus TaxID=66883 RepID=UPI0037A9F731